MTDDTGDKTPRQIVEENIERIARFKFYARNPQFRSAIVMSVVLDNTESDAKVLMSLINAFIDSLSDNYTTEGLVGDALTLTVIHAVVDDLLGTIPGPDDLLPPNNAMEALVALGSARTCYVSKPAPPRVVSFCFLRRYSTRLWFGIISHIGK